MSETADQIIARLDAAADRQDELRKRLRKGQAVRFRRELHKEKEWRYGHFVCAWQVGLADEVAFVVGIGDGVCGSEISVYPALGDDLELFGEAAPSVSAAPQTPEP
jgi:hypothetical protein